MRAELVFSVLVLNLFSVSQANALSLDDFNTTKNSQSCRSVIGKKDLTLQFKPNKLGSAIQLTIPAKLIPAKGNAYAQTSIFTLTQGKPAKPLQTLELNAELAPDFAYSDAFCWLRIEDFNFDGYLDIAAPRSLGATWLAYQFWFYDPTKKRFQTTEMSKALSALEASELSFDSNKKQVIEKKRSATYQEENVYTFEGDKLVPTKQTTPESLRVESTAGVMPLTDPVPQLTGLWLNEVSYEDGKTVKNDSAAVELCTNYSDWRKEALAPSDGEEDCDPLIAQQRGTQGQANWQFGTKEICLEEDGSISTTEYWAMPLSYKAKAISAFKWETRTINTTKQGKTTITDVMRGMSKWRKAQNCE